MSSSELVLNILAVTWGTWHLQVVPLPVWMYLAHDWQRAEQMRLMEEATAVSRAAELARQCVHLLNPKPYS